VAAAEAMAKATIVRAIIFTISPHGFLTEIDT